jgi:pantetheine-phosphate adenylyltransferase
MKRAIFTGSFDPFTIGHASIVMRALPLFDEIIIGIGVNESKTCMFSIDKRLQAISSLYADQPRIKVEAYNDLTVDFAKRKNADFIVKGLRCLKDFEYERDQADINRSLTGIETVMLYTEPQFAAISSSMVRELAHFGKSIDEYLPAKTTITL